MPARIVVVVVLLVALAATSSAQAAEPPRAHAACPVCVAVVAAPIVVEDVSVALGAGAAILGAVEVKRQLDKQAKAKPRPNRFKNVIAVGGRELAKAGGAPAALHRIWRKRFGRKRLKDRGVEAAIACLVAYAGVYIADFVPDFHIEHRTAGDARKACFGAAFAVMATPTPNSKGSSL